MCAEPRKSATPSSQGGVSPGRASQPADPRLLHTDGSQSPHPSTRDRPPGALPAGPKAGRAAPGRPAAESAGPRAKWKREALVKALRTLSRWDPPRAHALPGGSPHVAHPPPQEDPHVTSTTLLSSPGHLGTGVTSGCGRTGCVPRPSGQGCLMPRAQASGWVGAAVTSLRGAREHTRAPPPLPGLSEARPSHMPPAASPHTPRLTDR